MRKFTHLRRFSAYLPHYQYDNIFVCSSCSTLEYSG